MATSTSNWTREQLKLAFHFYCQTPFGKLHSRNPAIVELAKLVERSPDATAMKLVNFASLDPAIIGTGRRGLSGASKLDREIWEEFHADWERLAIECEEIRQRLLQQHGMTDSTPLDTSSDFDAGDFIGETRQAIIQQRIKQKFFRRAVLSSYRGRCCMSGLTDTRLLIASHIVPWSADKANRLNPSNGLCLSAIHDKAFEIGLITISEDLRVMLSRELRQRDDELIRHVFSSIDNKPIELPERFAPDPHFLAIHRTSRFLGA